MLNSAINGREAAITALRAGVAQGGGKGGPWWFILIGAQSFVLKGEGETGCWKQIPPDQLELCNKNTLIFLGTFA